uniref:Minichromosome loss protein Mcl1 middle region domain-containing protein n=1 Tax=Parascaris equorum TaxID=6256 RepID=A0A914RKY3_PAREQ
MPSEESIDNVVIGGCFVALATNLRFIRIFSHAGTQIIVLSHPGPILTMCAAGKRLTTVAVNSGYFFEDDKPQFNVYCVRLLTANGVWVPIHSFSSSMKSISDHVFLIGVVEYPHCELRYVYCKGIRYPPVASRLVPLVAPWNIPFCNAVAEIGRNNIPTAESRTTLDRRTSDGNNEGDLAPKPVIKRIYSSKRKLLDEGEEKTREAVVDDGDREEEQSADSRFDTSRKAAVVEESQENIFDSILYFQVVSRQSLLVFSPRTSEIGKETERKTGFELWMKSMENELRSHYDGDDDGFLKYATRQFRQLTADDKKQFDARRMRQILDELLL